MDVRVQLNMTSIGNVVMENGSLQFPPVPTSAGIYRFTLEGCSPHKSRVYVGETRNLRRRMAHYRSPGPSQLTNVRINQAMVLHLGTGAAISLHTAMNGWAYTDEQPRPLNLDNQFHRKLAENALLLWMEMTETINVMNLGNHGNQNEAVELPLEH